MPLSKYLRHRHFLMREYLHQSGIFGLFWDIYAPTNVCVKDIDSRASMVLQNYQKFIEMTSNMIYIVALGVGFKCPCKIHLTTQCPPAPEYQPFRLPTALQEILILLTGKCSTWNSHATFSSIIYTKKIAIRIFSCDSSIQFFTGT